MTKTLRLSLLSMLVMLCGSMFAQQVTLDFDNDYATLFPTLTGTSSTDSHDGDFTEATTSTAVNGVTVTVAPDAEAKTPSRIWSSAPRLRMYSGSFTVSGKSISKIEFTGHNTNFNLSTTTGTLDGKTWTGKADQVVFAVSKNTQINKIVVTLGEGGDTPDPDPDPDPQIQTVANIAAFKALAAKTEAELTLTNAEVLYVNGTNDIYVRDASGAIDFYKTGLNLTAGQKLNGSVIGINDAYNNTPELTKSSNTNDSKISATSGTVTAKSISASEAGNYVCDLVKLSGVSVTKNGNNYYVGDVQVYDKFKVVSGTPDVSKKYDIEGIVIMYKDVVEICPVKDYTDGTNPDPEPDEVKSVTIAEFNEAAESTNVWYQLKGEVKNLKDDDIYGNFDLEDATGSVYVYGLLSEKGGEKKQFQTLAAEKGIKNGCKITIIGNRSSYNDKIEVINAYFVSIDEAAPAELVISGETEFSESTTVTITPSDEVNDVYYTLDGSDPSDMEKATRYMGPFTITESCTIRAWEEDANLFAEKTFTKLEEPAEMSVEDVIAAAPESKDAADGQQKVWVKGYIVGFVNGQALSTGAVFGVEGCETNSNLLLATDPAETNIENCIPVQLPSGNIRNDLNLQDNPDNYGKEVRLYGHVLKYFGVPGLKNVTDYQFTGNNSVELMNAETAKNGKIYNIAGQRVNDSFKGIVIINGRKFMVK